MEILNLKTNQIRQIMTVPIHLLNVPKRIADLSSGATVPFCDTRNCCATFNKQVTQPFATVRQSAPKQSSTIRYSKF